MNVLLFDFGGTLDTNGVHWSEKFWEVYQRCGLRIRKDQFEEAYRKAELEIRKGIIHSTDSLETLLETQIRLQLQALAHQGVDVGRASKNLQSEIRRHCYDDVCRTIELICPILEYLQTKFRLGIISNFTGNLQRVIEELAIDAYFDMKVDSSVVGIEKPDPEIFRMTLRMFNTEAGHACVIGDSYDRDIVPAKLVGCTTVWLDGRSWKRPDRTDQADYIIHQLQELPTLVTTLSQQAGK